MSLLAGCRCCSPLSPLHASCIVPFPQVYGSILELLCGQLDVLRPGGGGSAPHAPELAAALKPLEELRAALEGRLQASALLCCLGPRDRAAPCAAVPPPPPLGRRPCDGLATLWLQLARPRGPNKRPRPFVKMNSKQPRQTKAIQPPMLLSLPSACAQEVTAPKKPALSVEEQVAEAEGGYRKEEAASAVRGWE